jgi:hypothetical protein
MLVPVALCATDELSPLRLLEDSYADSKQLSAENRAFLLVRLTDASTDIAPQHTETWSRELSDLAFTLPAGWNRIATEKNALVPLARVNPVLAFDRLGKVEKPVPHDGVFTEDLRSDAAGSIFPLYFRAGSRSALQNIRKQAKEFGDTGEYPYRAIGLIIDELFKSHTPESVLNDLFNEAVGYHQRKSVFLDSDPQFYELLQYSRYAVSDALYKKAVLDFVAHLRSNDSNEPREFFAEIHTVEGIHAFTSQRELLLFQIYPTVLHIDRNLAAELAQQYPSLLHAGAEIQSISASGIVGGSEQTAESATAKRARERLLLRTIQHLRDSDPISALKEANLVESEPDRSNALAYVIPALVGIDRVLAMDTYTELTQRVETLPQGVPRLGGLLASAKAACEAGYGKSCADYITETFDYGFEMFDSDSLPAKESVTQRQSGFLELTGIAELGGEYIPEQSSARLKTIKDPGLRGYLRLSAARGLQQRERTNAHE